MVVIVWPKHSRLERERQLLRLYRAEPSMALLAAAVALWYGAEPKRQEAMDCGDCVSGLALDRVPVLDDVLGFLKLRFRSSGVTEPEERCPLKDDFWVFAAVESAAEEGDIAYLVSKAITTLELMPSLRFIFWEHFLGSLHVTVVALVQAARLLSPGVPEEGPLGSYAELLKAWLNEVKASQQLAFPIY